MPPGRRSASERARRARWAAAVTGSARLAVERLGGLAGVGLPGSRLRSHGEIDLGKLSPSEQGTVERLFQNPPAAPAKSRDAFRYRLTRQTEKGPQSVEVHEDAVPEVVRSCVVDELT
jgi:emfourin